MKTKRQMFPGNVYKRGNKLWIRYKSERYSADCYDTPQGWEYARAILRKRYMRDLESSGAVEKKIKPQTIGEIFDEYISEKKSMGWSAQTERNYRLAFSKFQGIINQYPNTELIERAILHVYTDESYSRETGKTYVRQFRVFCRWAEDNKKFERINFRKFNLSPGEREFTEYTFEEYRALLKYHIDGSKQVKDTRYGQETADKSYLFYVLLLCMSQIGARRGETIDLRINQIDFDDNTITFANKINKQTKEKLVITRPLEYPLRKAIEIAMKNNYPDGKIFPWNNLEAVGRRLRRAEKALGIEHIPMRGFHAFRKAYSERLFDAELPLDLIQQAMRHKDIHTTIKHYKKRETNRLRVALSGIKTYSKKAD